MKNQPNTTGESSNQAVCQFLWFDISLNDNVKSEDESTFLMSLETFAVIFAPLKLFARVSSYGIRSIGSMLLTRSELSIILQN